MKTIALRFSDNFSTEKGTIEEHKDLITSLGYAWYGKLGSKVSSTVANEIMTSSDPKILLIHSGKIGRYWAHIDKISFDVPTKRGIPKYYRHNADKFRTWFRVTSIEAACRDILGKCVVSSSGRPLSEVSKYSMSPYFIINVEGDNE